VEQEAGGAEAGSGSGSASCSGGGEGEGGGAVTGGAGVGIAGHVGGRESPLKARGRGNCGRRSPTSAGPPVNERWEAGAMRMRERDETRETRPSGGVGVAAQGKGRR